MNLVMKQDNPIQMKKEGQMCCYFEAGSRKECWSCKFAGAERCRFATTDLWLAKTPFFLEQTYKPPGLVCMYVGWS